MKYRNIKTGAVIDTTSEISGEDWQAIVPAKASEKEKTSTQPRRRGKQNG